LPGEARLVLDPLRLQLTDTPPEYRQAAEEAAAYQPRRRGVDRLLEALRRAEEADLPPGGA
jgi:hypothetical protein